MLSQPGLFDMQPIAPPAHAPARKWGGSRSTKAREKVRAMLPAPCFRCGGIITREDPESTWHADHVTERMHGGTDDQLAPAHARCNTAAGGRLGAAITNGRRPGAELARERTVKWW